MTRHLLPSLKIARSRVSHSLCKNYNNKRFFNTTMFQSRSLDNEDVPDPVWSRPHRAPDVAHNFAKPSGTTEEEEAIRVTFIEATGRKVHCTGMHGQGLLHLAYINGIEINTNCQGAIHPTCPGCHVIIPEEWFHRLRASNPTEDSKLDSIEESRWNSRLACQIVLDKSMDGIVVGVGPVWIDNTVVDTLTGDLLGDPFMENLRYDLSSLSKKELKNK